MGIYVGLGSNRRVFKADIEPTYASHGHLFPAVMGPFKTMRAARFFVEHGQGNPHIAHVNDAERIAKLLATS